MKVLNNNIDLTSFFNNLRESERSLLFLDYDGTLAPFHIDPRQARPYPGIYERLHHLITGTTTRTIIISGRAMDDLLPLLQIETLPELWGSHGGERFTKDRRYFRVALSEKQQAGLHKAQATCEKCKLPHFCEFKPLSVSLHWRGQPEAIKKKLQEEFLAEWNDISENYDLEILPFDGGLEIRAKGQNKGLAVQAICNEMDDMGLSIPIAYLGDDSSDEEAFEVLDDRGLKVLVRHEWRPTLADIQLDPPTELTNFLDSWIGCFKKKKNPLSQAAK